MKKDVWAAGNLYEPYVGRWSRVVAKEFLAWLAVPAGRSWLDVGCGTGALTQCILRDAAPARVLGLDPSAGFVEHARAHTADGNAAFEIGDAQSLPVDSGEFDAAVAGLVLNFVPQPARAVGEMRRAPGYCMSLDEAKRAALRERIRTKLPLRPDGSIHLVARAWAVKGSVPTS